MASDSELEFKLFQNQGLLKNMPVCYSIPISALQHLRIQGSKIEHAF